MPRRSGAASTTSWPFIWKFPAPLVYPRRAKRRTRTRTATSLPGNPAVPPPAHAPAGHSSCQLDPALHAFAPGPQPSRAWRWQQPSSGRLQRSARGRDFPVPSVPGTRPARRTRLGLPAHLGGSTQSSLCGALLLFFSVIPRRSNKYPGSPPSCINLTAQAVEFDVPRAQAGRCDPCAVAVVQSSTAR